MKSMTSCDFVFDQSRVAVPRIALHRLLSSQCCGRDQKSNRRGRQQTDSTRSRSTIVQELRDGLQSVHLPHNTEGGPVLSSAYYLQIHAPRSASMHTSRKTLMPGRYITKTQAKNGRDMPIHTQPCSCNALNKVVRCVHLVYSFSGAHVPSSCLSMGHMMRYAASWPAQASPAPFRDHSSHIPLSIPVRPSFSHT